MDQPNNKESNMTIQNESTEELMEGEEFVCSRTDIAPSAMKSLKDTEAPTSKSKDIFIQKKTKLSSTPSAEVKIPRGSPSSESTNIMEMSFTSDDLSFSICNQNLEQMRNTTIFQEDSVLNLLNSESLNSNTENFFLVSKGAPQHRDDDSVQATITKKESFVKRKLKRLKVNEERTFEIFRSKASSLEWNDHNEEHPFNIYTDSVPADEISKNGNSEHNLYDLLTFLSSSTECSAANSFQRNANKNVTKLFDSQSMLLKSSSEDLFITYDATKNPEYVSTNDDKLLVLGTIDDRMTEVFRDKSKTYSATTPVKVKSETFNIYTDSRQDNDMNQRDTNLKSSERSGLFITVEKKRSSLAVLKSPPTGSRTPLGRIQNTSKGAIKKINSIQKSKIMKKNNTVPSLLNSKPVTTSESGKKNYEKENVGCS